MKVEDVMTAAPACCRPNETLSRAAEIMWEMDCGVVPVVNEENRVVGVVTDRDICIAAASRNRLTSEIRVGEMNFAPLKVCAPDDDLKDALKRMRKHRIRRLCVTDDGGRPVGILSLSDVIAKVDKKSVRKLVFSTLSAISRPAPIVLSALDEAAAPATPEPVPVAEADDDEEDGDILETDVPAAAAPAFEGEEAAERVLDDEDDEDDDFEDDFEDDEAFGEDDDFDDDEEDEEKNGLTNGK